MTSPIHITDDERRARLVARHHLDRTAADVLAAVNGVVALHSSDPATPYLACRARANGFHPGDLDAALLRDRSLWRLHAMRRTLFIVPSTDWPIFEAAAARDIARQEWRRVEGWLRAEMGSELKPGLVQALTEEVLDLLGDGTERRTQELTAAIPDLAMNITIGSGKWTARSPLSSRLLYLMAMEGRIVRTRAAGSWRSSQYRWAATTTWFGEVPASMEPEQARSELVRRYLASYAPATLEDVRWWTGWTAKHAAAALAAIGALEARLDGSRAGRLLPDDRNDSTTPVPQVAFLPALDPTPMGWKERDWYLGPHTTHLFDRSGNIGPSIWLDGRIVGGWAQRPDGEAVYRLLEDVGTEGTRRIEAEADAVTKWLAGTVVVPRFRTPLERILSAGAAG